VCARINRRGPHPRSNEEEDDVNIVVLIGTVSREPELRDLASGERVLSFDLTASGAGERSDTVPVAWLDPPTKASLTAGDAVVVTGRVRRRFFKTAAGIQSRTEVTAEHVVPRRQRKRAQGAIDRSVDHLVTALEGPG